MYEIEPEAQGSPPVRHFVRLGVAVALFVGLLLSIRLRLSRPPESGRAHVHEFRDPVAGGGGGGSRRPSLRKSPIPPDSADALGDPLPPGAIRRYGTARFRQGAEVRALSFGASDEELIAGGSDGSLISWETGTGKVRARWKSWSPVSDIVRLPEGTLATAGGSDAAWLLRDPATGEPRRRLWGGWNANYSSATRYAIASSPDGRFIVTTGPGDVLFVWDGPSGNLLHELPGAGRKAPLALAFLDPTRFAVFTSAPEIVHWDAPTGKVSATFPIPDRSRSEVVASPDGRLFAMPSGSVTRFYETESGKEAKRVACGGHLLAFSSDGKKYVVVDAAQARVGAVDSVEESVVGLGRIGYPTAIALSRDGSRLAVGTWSGVIAVFDVETGNRLAPPDGPFQRIAGLAWIEGGQGLVSVSNDGLLRIHAAVSGNVLREMEIGEGRMLQGLPDGGFTAVTGSDTHIFDVRGDRLRVVPRGVTGTWGAGALSPDGKWLAATERLELWNLETGKLEKSLGRENETWTALAFSPASDELAGTTSRTKELVLWSMPDGAEKWRGPIPTQFEGYPSAPVYTPNGHLLLVGNSFSARTMKAGGRNVGLTYCVAGFPRQNPWAPDGNGFAENSWGRARTTHFTTYPGAWPRSTVRGHSARPTAAAWSPASTEVAVGCEDGTIVLWDCLGEPVAEAPPVVLHPESPTSGPPVLRFAFDGNLDATGIFETRFTRLPPNFSFVEGPRGQALHFRTARDGRRLEFPECESVGLPADATVQFWYRVDDGPWVVPVEAGSGAVHPFLQFLSCDVITLDVRDSLRPLLFFRGIDAFGEASGHGNLELGAPRAGEWNHVALVRRSATVRLHLFVNGVETQNTTGMNPSPVRVGQLTLGTWGGELPLGGAIDELEFYNYARSPAQIAADAAR